MNANFLQNDMKQRLRQARGRFICLFGHLAVQGVYLEVGGDEDKQKFLDGIGEMKECRGLGFQPKPFPFITDGGAGVAEIGKNYNAPRRGGT